MAGAGGKLVTNRRKQRLAATPYDRPPPTHQPSKSPSWFTGVIIPSARALASGAGKILSAAIFSDSESSSSDDEDSTLKDDADNFHENDSPYDGVNELNEKKGTSSEIMQHGQESQFSMQRTETKQIIKQLIMRETFSREECDKLIKVLNSRVMDMSAEVREKRPLENFPGKTVDHEDVDAFNKAVLEAKKWFQGKKVMSSSVAELAHGTSNLKSIALGHVESGIGSPVDVARSYMRDRPRWASPVKHEELGTPFTATMKLFKEGTSYSVNHDFSSSSKRWSPLASGSWNIQEELWRVRSKATEDMLRASPTRIDLSMFAVAPPRLLSAGAGKIASDTGERMAEPHSFWKTKQTDLLMDVGVSSDPALVALESREDGKAKASKALSSNPAVSVSGNNGDSEAIQIGGERAPFKLPPPATPNHVGERHSSKLREPPEGEEAEFGGRGNINGFTSCQASLSLGPAMAQKHEQHDEENHNFSHYK